MDQKQKYEQFKGQTRLPKFAVPKHYDLFLKPDLSACKFSGSVDISVEVLCETNVLILNATELIIDSNSVIFNSSNKVLEAITVEQIKADEIIVAEFDDSLPIGVGILSISFQGTLNDNMKGFYKSIYEHNGEKKNMAVTEFEPTYARCCFPCWDEPAYKATFKITLDVPLETVALSNMPIIQEKVNGNHKTVYYQESQKMSTYLVAVVVGLFDYIEAYTTDGIPVRVYCQPGKTDQGKFALDVAVKSLSLFKKYFDVPYSLPKLDMVAILDFSGAMENYGLITYRETELLYDEKNSSAANKQRVAIVVAHEVAHQWFGNLVTMEWWTDLWLNEGFATWVSYLAIDNFFPEWKIWTRFLEEGAYGLRLDALAESHPVEVDVHHAGEVSEIFDEISYCKGASVIRMIQSFLGPESFQKALVSYIKKYANSNAKTEDLWSVLEEESGEPVKKLMNSWTKQVGYPVISVQLKDQGLELKQRHFLLGGSPSDGQWIVPITVCCGSYNSRKSFLLKTKSEALNITSDSWVKINVDQTGFYRVKYDEELYNRLISAIENKSLSTMDRYGILDDSFALSMACQQSLTSLLVLMSAFREELDHSVLSNMITISYKVARIAADAVPELLDDIKQFFINIFQNTAERLGWDPKQGESHLDAVLRGEILYALAELGHEATVNEANRRFQMFLNDRNTPLLPPDLRKVVYMAVMQNVSVSDRSGYDSLIRLYRETHLSLQEKTQILGSLDSCHDPEIILDILNFLLSSEVRTQDVACGLPVNREGRETVWQWFKEKWDFIFETYGSGFVTMGFIRVVVSSFTSSEKAQEIEEFFANRMKPSIARTLKQSIERIRIDAKWIKSIQDEEHLPDTIRELSYNKY